MSTRRGEVVLVEDFMKEIEEKAKKEIQKRKTKGDAKKVGIAAIKYSLIKNSPDRNIIFNMEEAMNFEGNSGPYLQYSYVRANNIIKKAPQELLVESDFGDFDVQLNSIEKELLRYLSRFPEVVYEAG